MNDVQIFSNSEFGEIRTVIIDGEPWFVAKDIAEKLGYAKTFNMTKQIDEDDKQIFDCSSQEHANFNSMTRNIGIINESGLYSAIMYSTLKNAKRFKRWVTKEVLPSIRRTGAYGQPQLPQSTDDKIALLAQGHVELVAKIDNLEQRFNQLQLDMPIFGEECTEVNAAVAEKVKDILGGKQSSAYQDKTLHRKLYRDIYGQTNRQFGVRTYKSIKRSQLRDYILSVERYIPPIRIQNDIDACNAQQSFDL